MDISAIRSPSPPPTARDFAPPPGVVEARICADTGDSAPRDGATAACASTRVEYFRNQREVPARRGAAAVSQDQLLRDRFLDAEHGDLMAKLAETKTLSDEIVTGLDEAIRAFRDTFLADQPAAAPSSGSASAAAAPSAG